MMPDSFFHPILAQSIVSDLLEKVSVPGMHPIWWVIGFAGQAVFGCRFLVQWIASERAGRSYIPVVFWYISILGSIFLCSYAIRRGDPVFILGFSLNTIVYTRNLMLIGKEKRALATEAGATAEGNADER